MALDLGTLAAKLKLDDAEFQKTLKKAPKDAEEAGKKVGEGVTKGTEKGTARLGEVFGKIGAAAVLGLGAATIAGVAAVHTFAELQDATAAAGVVFGDEMAKIERASERAAATLGMSRQQYIDAAITMGTFGKSAGLTGEKLSAFSNQMVQLAGDMASFRGTTPEDAIEAVGAALRGEMEPIRKYGVLLDDATLRQQALAMGLIATTKEALSPQVKVLAAQAAILKQTADAQGDFARTSDSTANVEKTLAAETQNAAAAFGQKLAPMLTAVQRAGIGVIQWATANSDALVPLVSVLGLATGALVALTVAAKAIEGLEAAKATIDALSASFDGLSTKAKIAAASAGAIGLALAAASVAYGIFAQANADAQQRVEDLTAAVKLDSGAIGENSRAWAANALQKSGALDAANKLGISSGLLVDAALGEASAAGAVEAAYARYTDSLKWANAAQMANAASEKDRRTAHLDSVAAAIEGADAYNLLKQQLGLIAPAAQAAVTANQQVTDAVGDSTTATKGNTRATDANTTSAEENATALHKLYTARLKLRGDKRALEAAIDDATESIKKNGKTLDENTPKGRANAQALDDIVTAGLAVGGNMTRARTAFINAATAMGMSKAEAKKLATQLGLIKSKTVDIKVRIKATGNVDPSSGLKVYVTGNGRKLMARGGPVTGGVPGRDSVPILGMPGEYMLNVDDVAALGGHAGVYQMLKLARSGMLDPSSAVRSQRALSQQYQQPSRAAADRPQIVVHATTHYPIAEPTSVTTNRALQYAAALGGI